VGKRGCNRNKKIFFLRFEWGPKGGHSTARLVGSIPKGWGGKTAGEHTRNHANESTGVGKGRPDSRVNRRGCENSGGRN